MLAAQGRVRIGVSVMTRETAMRETHYSSTPLEILTGNFLAICYQPNLTIGGRRQPFTRFSKRSVP